MFPHMEVQVAINALVNNGYKPFFLAYDENEDLSYVVPFYTKPDEDCLQLLSKIQEEGHDWNVIGNAERLRHERYEL